MNPDPSAEPGFEDALGQLERIVAHLEQGEPDLSAALARYEEAIRLLAHCHGLIDGAEQAVAVLTGVDDQGRPLTAPFDATATAPRESKPTSARKTIPSNANPSLIPDNDDSSVPF